MYALRRYWPLWLLCLSLTALTTAHAADSNVEQRVIVKWKTDHNRSRSQAFSAASSRMNTLTGAGLVSGRQIDERMEVVRFSRELSIVGFESALETLRNQTEVEYAVPDQRRFAHSVPNDPDFIPSAGRTGQWYLRSTTTDPNYVSAIDAEDAWDLANVKAQSSNVIVAVVDTGVRLDHPDLSSKVLSGYDFVSCDQSNCSGSGLTYLTANDGDGWDSDPSDPGDWINSTDQQNSLFKNCDVSGSSWHGTRVSGIIGATPNNNAGIAGIGWNVRILPVRVLGKCGGYDSDIIAGMKWAAGIHVANVPDNTANKAKIINLSLGAAGDCKTDPNYAAYRDAITQIHNANVVIVASAGNDSSAVNAPANCSGVIGVAGLRNTGTKVGFSSLGSSVAIAAPAGNCGNSSGACLYSIDTTYNLGTTTATTNDYTDQTNSNLGTSFSSPIVSGTLAMMFAVNSSLSPSMAQSRLQAAATAFPATASLTCHVPTSSSDTQSSECNCTTSTCGAGMVNALKAVQYATQTVVAYITGANTAGANKPVSLDGSGSSSLNGGPLTYTWSIVSGGGTLSNASTATPTFTAPASPDSSIVSLTVSDGANTSEPRSFTITTYAAPTASISGATTATGGSGVTLTATATTGDGSTPSYAWSITSGTGTLSSTNQSTVTVTTPNTSETLVIHLIATDDVGNSATADHSIAISGVVSNGGVGNAMTSTSTTSSGGGGGGSLGFAALLALGMLTFARVLRRNSSTTSP